MDKNGNFDEEERERIYEALRNAIMSVLVFLAACICLSLFCGCRGYRVSGCDVSETQLVIVRDTLVVKNTARDSVYVRDSVVRETYLAGDTVYLTLEKWHTRYKDRLVRDTMIRVERDTMWVEKDKEVVLEPKKTLWEKAGGWIGQAMMWVIALAGIMLAIGMVMRWIFDRR